MRLEGDRLFLRPLTDGDCSEAYVGWLNDPEVSRFLESCHTVQDLAAIQNFVRRVNESGNEFLFGIFLKGTGRHIGNIKVGPVGRYHPVADVGLLIGERDCWGKGYAVEAIGLVSRYAFEHLDVRKLSASMYAKNQGSFRAFLKAGYKKEGHRRGHGLVGGAMSDSLEVGLIPSDLANNDP